MKLLGHRIRAKPDKDPLAGTKQLFGQNCKGLNCP